MAFIKTIKEKPKKFYIYFACWSTYYNTHVEPEDSFQLCVLLLCGLRGPNLGLLAWCGKHLYLTLSWLLLFVCLILFWDKVLYSLELALQTKLALNLEIRLCVGIRGMPVKKIKTVLWYTLILPVDEEESRL